VRSRRRDEIAAELQSHIELEEAELRASGLPPDEARRLARLKFGSITSAQEQTLAVGRWLWLEAVWHDLRYGGRLMRRSPAFTITAVFVLAIGIGVNAALFSVINGMLFRDLHVEAPERLVYLHTRSPHGRVLSAVSQDAAAIFRESGRELADFTAHLNTPADVTVDGETYRLPGEIVETNYFDLLGVHAERGRAFRTEDSARSNPDLTVVVSQDFWMRRLAADTEAVGKQLRLNGRMFTIIGIAPRGFAGLASPFRPSQWWVPHGQVAEGGWDLGPIARLKRGVDVGALEALIATRTPDLVRDEWERLDRDRGAVWPWEVYRNKGYSVARVVDVDIPSHPESRLVPSGVVAAAGTVSGLVLVIACANIAGLLLARGMSRSGEVAVRLALGAARGRLLRQIMTEALLLGAAGTMVGIGVAHVLVGLVTAVTPETFNLPAQLDVRVLAVAVCGAVMTAVLVGLTPAIQASRVQLIQSLGSGVGGSRGTHRSLARWVVIPQVTVSTVLVLAAAVHVRALYEIESRDRGYRANDTAVFPIALGRDGLDLWTLGMLDRTDAATDRVFTGNVLDATAAVPGIEQFALVSQLPLQGSFRVEKPVVEQQSAGGQAPTSPVSAVEFFVSDGYFELMGMRLLAGRTFDERERRYVVSGPRAAVVSASIASAFGGPTLVGRSIALSSGSGAQPQWLEVVGVVNDIDPGLNDGRAHPVVYEALGQQPHPSPSALLVRGRGDRAALLSAVRTAIIGVTASAEIGRVRMLDELAADMLYPRRLAAGILAGASAVCLVLACIGLYGIVSYAAAERTRELGIRATLGATRYALLRLILREGAIVVSVGITSGLLLGALALRASPTVTLGVPAFDLALFLATPVMLLVVGLVAGLPPALRASRSDPAQAVRGE
jgi:predicted permease